VNTYSFPKDDNDLTDIEKLEIIKNSNLQELLCILKAFESNEMEFSDEVMVECISQLRKHNMFYL
jgi:hypothetical protein